MHDDRKLVEGRVDRVLRDRIRPAIYPESVGCEIAAWQVLDEPVPVADGLAAEYEPAAVGDRWGPAWGTSWFRVTGKVPAGWHGRRVEAIINLGFDQRIGAGFQSEGLVYLPDGSPVKGLHPYNDWVRVTDKAEGGEDVLLYVEGAANPVILGDNPFRPTPLGDKRTAGSEPLYQISRVELAVFDERVWNLVLDIEVLSQLMHELSDTDARRWEITRTLERALDALDLANVGGTAEAAREILAEALKSPANPSAHRISAVGHAHIDSAWLWPLRETVRKVARTASNVTALMDDHPEFVFAMSQAQQLAWIKDHRPEVFAKVAKKIAAGQFVPVGGMWVESDTNMPGAEAMARQFVHGKRFFLDVFGVETEEVWLPDSFGYSAALPQLVTLSGSRWFLTQKISWNQTNVFPHHTFWWEGIDGTRVFTHFPPVDTYNSDISGREMARAARNFNEKGGASRSLVPFGWGDGGGGPTREMLGRAARLSDVEGSPMVEVERPSEFFRKAEAEYPNAPVWVGELYLEFHRGTYTSQARTKQGNRRSEHLLREAELWCTTAAIRKNAEYPYEQLDKLWKTVLLHQFHDILPGSSIAWVHREAEKEYARVSDELEKVITKAQRTLAGSGDRNITFNAAPHQTEGIVALGAGALATPDGTVSVKPTEDGGFVLNNGVLRIVIAPNGTLSSIRDLKASREVIPPGGSANLLQLHPDHPNQWDAWDVDKFYRNTVTDLLDVGEVSVAEIEQEHVTVLVERTFGDSRVRQTLTLWAGARALEIDTDVDWHETEKFLKLAFDVDVHTDRAAAEVQFGHVYRPTHSNTTWDAAKFEICAHRWVHVAEPGYGVALANDSSYGHDITHRGRAGGGTATTIRASLLRAPRFPDPDTDHGRHELRHSLVVGVDVDSAVREGYRINLPTRTVTGGNGVVPVVEVDNPNVVVESVKLADDRSGDVVVRLYESAGGRASAVVHANFGLRTAASTDLLERRWSATVDYPVSEDEIALDLRPFEIVTLRLARS